MLKGEKQRRQLLWQEYLELYPEGFRYSRFCELLDIEMAIRKPTMHLTHNPVELLEIDFAGSKLCYVNEDSEIIECPVFVAVFPFSGVIAFILSDLVTIPMLMVFRKYYGNKTMWYLLAILVVSIFAISLFLDYSFAALHRIPKTHTGEMQMTNRQFKWDYQTWLNLFFIPVSIAYFYWGRKP